MMQKDIAKFLKPLHGQWIGIGGNRHISAAEASQVKKITKSVIQAGLRIVTGGAGGVDKAVLEACLKCRIGKNHLKVFLPYTIQKQHEHYRKLEGLKVARSLFRILLTVEKNYSQAIIENHRRFTTYRKAADFRNQLMVKKISAAIVFKPERSIGSLRTLEYLRKKQIPFIVF